MVTCHYSNGRGGEGDRVEIEVKSVGGIRSLNYEKYRSRDIPSATGNTLIFFTRGHTIYRTEEFDTYPK